MVQKLLKYPTQLMPNTPYQYLNSPDFSKYIDYEENFNIFILRDLRTQELIAKIPHSSMKLRGGETPTELMKRFEWIDNRHFKFITVGGVERLIDIEQDFEEKEYNFVQEFEPHKVEVKHFYNC